MQIETYLTRETRHIPSGRITQMAFYSFCHFFRLVAGGLLHMPRKRVGMIYQVGHKGSYMVFRETVHTHPPLHMPVVLMIGFRLKWIDSSPFFHYLFQRICILTTPFWAGLSGFYTKLWMVDPITKNYMGIYEWRGRDEAQQYINALIPVLRFFSLKDTIWYTIHLDRNLDPFLHGLPVQNPSLK